MQVTLGVLADYANVTREGKLNVLGIFDRINARGLPAIHHAMQLVMRLEAHYAELGRAHSIEIRLHDPDGDTIFEVKGDFTPRGGTPGELTAANQIIAINNLTLPKEGGYTFAIFVDGDLKKQIPLRVQRVGGDPAQQQLLPGG